MHIGRPAASRVRDVGFFAAFLVYVWAGVDPRLIFHGQGPVFTTIPGFFAEFLTYAGGPADYLQSLIAQACASRLWGTVSLTAQVAAVVALSRVYFTTLAGGNLPSWASALSFGPALVLAYQFSLYSDRTPVLLALLAALALGVLLIRQSRRWPSEAALAAMSLAALGIAYYLAGMAEAVMVPLVVLIGIARRLRPLFGLVLLFLGAVFIRTQSVYTALYLVYAAGGALLVWRPLPGAESPIPLSGVGLPAYPRRPEVAPGALRPPCRRQDRRRYREGLVTAAVLLAMAGVATFSYRNSGRDRRLTALDYEVSRENWAAVIEDARHLPAADFNSLTRYEVNLALHESHLLGDEMFRIPQKAPMLLDLRADPFLPYMIRVTDLCLRLGRLNEAERFGSEAMLLRQRDPRVYRQLASVLMIKGRSAAARKFLTVLSYDSTSRNWARERLRQLDQDPGLAGDAKVQFLRQRMLQTDDVMPVWQRPGKASADLDRLLLDQLEQDPSNRMAFEFLMGNYLLARDMVSVHALMPRIANLTGPGYVETSGRRRTPRHYQEAMAIYANATGKSARIPGVVIEPETQQRFETFKNTVRQYVTQEAAMQAVWRDFRDTYFFYFTFGPGDYR